MEEELSIKVNIGDRYYPLKIKAEEEEVVRKAAKLINEKAQSYQENFSMKDKQDALAMAALEFATEVLSKTDNSEEVKRMVDAKISQFNIMLNHALR
jgi:cell division protein ZapA